jgi:signal transduction histidine kinase/HAMP domain-containing protein
VAALPDRDTPAEPARPRSGSLAWRLALRVGLAGVAAFVLIAGVVGWLERQRLEAQAREQARQNIEAVRDALAATVWQMDRGAQTLLLGSLVRDGSIVGVWIVEAGEVRNDAWRTLRAATPSFGGIAPWKVPLYGPDSGAAIAELWVQESLHEVAAAPLSRLATVAVAEALKVALVVAVVLWLVNGTLTQPLRRLAAGVRRLDLAEPRARLELGRPAKAAGQPSDELDELTDSIERLHAGQAEELRRRVQAEQRAAEQAAEQALILATLGEGVMAFDHNGQPLYANRAAVALLELGSDLREGLLRAIGERREFWRERFRQLRQQARAAGGPVQILVAETMRRPSGAELPAEIGLTALPHGPLGFVIVLRDASAERAAEQTRDESRAARAADRAKSEFLSRMSHELRTPLNAVLGFADVLLAGTAGAAEGGVQPLSPRQRQLVGHMRGAGVHLLRLISDLLDLSRIEAGTLSLDLQPLPAAPLVGECVELISPTAQARGIAVALRVEGPQPALLSADETRLRQVLMNLLSNAVKYNREGGRIEVVLRCGEARVAIEVADTGLGMTAEQRERLFTPFVRLGRERSSIEGTGIGLVIARHLVQMMGGELRCESRAGEGSRFTVELPRLAGEPAPSPAMAGGDGAPPIARSDVAGRLVLVEDNEINRLMIELYLAHRPAVALHAAADVDSGIALVRRERPRLALIDMHLGHRSGAEVLAAVKADPACAGTVCVAFTADALPEQQAALLAQGFDATWTKPLGLVEFLERLDAAMLQPAAGSGESSRAASTA